MESKMREEALEVLENHTPICSVDPKAIANPRDLVFMSWPENFNTTAGPSGVGGCALTAFQVYAFIDYDRNLVVIKCCNTRKTIKIRDFKPMMKVWKGI